MKERWAVVSAGTFAVAVLGAAVLMTSCSHSAGKKEEPLPPVTPSQRADPTPAEIDSPPPPSAVAVPARPMPDAAGAPAFMTPIEVPEAIEPEDGLSLGVEAGSPGGVVGGIVGGLAAPEPLAMTRAFGSVHEEGCAADGTKGAHGGIHSPGDVVEGFGE